MPLPELQPAARLGGCEDAVGLIYLQELLVGLDARGVELDCRQKVVLGLRGVCGACVARAVGVGRHLDIALLSAGKRCLVKQRVIA